MRYHELVWAASWSWVAWGRGCSIRWRWWLRCWASIALRWRRLGRAAVALGRQRWGWSSISLAYASTAVSWGGCFLLCLLKRDLLLLIGKSIKKWSTNLVLDEVNLWLAWSQWRWRIWGSEVLDILWFLYQHVNESLLGVLSNCGCLLLWRVRWSRRSLDEDDLVMFLWSSSSELQLLTLLLLILWWWNVNVDVLLDNGLPTWIWLKLIKRLKMRNF